MANLATVWFTGIPPEKKTSFEQAVRSSTVALGKLGEILDQKETSILSLLTTQRFDTPSWSEQTAGLLGQLKEIRDLKALVAFAR